MTKTRGREHRIEIEASAEEVWNALTDAEEVIRWYAPQAEVSAEEGGRYWVSWGEGMDGWSRITSFEPARHLALTHAWEGADTLDPPIIDEYHLESDGERTVVRLTQSGIPDTAEWDDFYEDTNRGWRMFLAGLRHYLERHLGTPRESVSFMHPVTGDVDQAWQKLIGPEGLAAEGSLEAVTVGERRSLTTAFGQDLAVEIVQHEPPMTLSMTIDNLQDSLLALDFERMGGKTFLYANLSTFGVGDEELNELRSRWKRWLEQLFPPPADPAAG